MHKSKAIVAQESQIEGFLSIDVSKDTLDAQIALGVAPGQAIPTVSNQRKGWNKLWKEAQKAGINKLYITVEATGSYWKKLAAFFYEKGAIVFVVNPACIKGQRKAELKRSKTDKIDAGLILNFTRANLNHLRSWSPPSDSIIQLQSLVRFRELRVGEQTRLKNLLKSGSACPLVLRLAKRGLESVETEILQIEEAINSLIENSEHRVQDLSAQSVPGIGPVTSAVLIAECRGFKEIRDPRQTTAFAGLDVQETSSGTMRCPPRISHKGSSLLRKTFYCAAKGALRTKTRNTFRDLYERLRKKGMKHKPACVAVARKLLEVTVAIVLKESFYDVSFYKPQNTPI